MKQKDNYNEIYAQLISQGFLNSVGNGVIKGITGIGKGIKGAWKWNKNRKIKNNINNNITEIFNQNINSINTAIQTMQNIVYNYKNKRQTDINNVITDIKEQKQLISNSILAIKENLPHNTVIMSFLNDIEKIGINTSNFINNHIKSNDDLIKNYIDQQINTLQSKLQRDFLKSSLVTENYNKIYLKILYENNNSIYTSKFTLNNYINADDSFALNGNLQTLSNSYRKLIEKPLPNQSTPLNFTYADIIDKLNKEYQKLKGENNLDQEKINLKNKLKNKLDQNISLLNKIYKTFKNIFNKLNKTSLLGFNEKLINLLNTNYGDITINDKNIIIQIIQATEENLVKISTPQSVNNTIKNLRDELNAELNNPQVPNELIKNEDDINQFKKKQQTKKAYQDNKTKIVNKISKIISFSNYINMNLKQNNIILKILKAFKKDTLNNISNFNLNITLLESLVKSYFIAGMISNYNENLLISLK